MFSSRSLMLILTFLIIVLFFPMNTISQSRRSDQKITRGRVIEISRNFITVDKTTIALTRTIKSLDVNGNSISLENIKKGDHVSVRIEKDVTIIKKVFEPREGTSEEIVPR